MNQLLKYTLLLFLVAFAACSSEDDGAPSVPNGQPQPGDALELTVSAADFVTDSAPDTRATDNGKETNFEEGDRVGIIILDEDDKPIYNNIPYKYNNGKWTFDSGNDEGKGECYYDSKATTFIVYYPYSRAVDGVTSVDVLKTKFAPKFNQSDIKDYRSSDLMVWSNSSLTPPVKKLIAELKHAFASVYLTPTAYRLDDGKGIKCSVMVSDVSLTIGDNVYVPYHATDGSLRCIVPANINPSGIRCFYTFSGTTYGNTISIQNAVKSNTRYISAPEIINKTYSLNDAKIGDFYCRNSNNKGYLIPGEATLTQPQQAACIGIVMKVGKDHTGDWKDDCQYKLKDNITQMQTVHGYVLALYDANEGNPCQWGTYGIEVGSDNERETGFYGYKNTQTITKKSQKLQSDFPATYHATTSYDRKYSAPLNSSGWFLPSAGQCMYWVKNERTLLTQIRRAMGSNSYDWKGYWSSSESNAQPRLGAYYMHYGHSIRYDGKNGSRYVRSCLAF